MSFGAVETIAPEDVDYYFEQHSMAKGDTVGTRWVFTNKADEIAERILTLEGTPAHNFTDYKAKAEIHELKDVNDATKGVKSIIDSLGVLIRLERQLLSVAQNANDEGTSALMSDYIREQEKLVWMYSAYLSQ